MSGFVSAHPEAPGSSDRCGEWKPNIAERPPQERGRPIQQAFAKAMLSTCLPPFCPLFGPSHWSLLVCIPLAPVSNLIGVCPCARRVSKPQKLLFC